MKEMQIKKNFDKNDTLVVKGIAILLMLFYHLFESRELLETLQVNQDRKSTRLNSSHRN